MQRRIVKHRVSIDATLEHGLSNGLVESTNTKTRLITRQAFGFHGPEPLIALAMLSPRRLLPTPPRPRQAEMTHGSVRRAANVLARVAVVSGYGQLCRA